MKHFRIALRALALATLAAAPGLVQTGLAQTGPNAAEAERVEVLIVGTYHMGNPGADIFNVEADDVLSPKRQAEMREVLGVLERFRPTKIALEASFNSRRAPREYADYLAGTYELERNEIDQLGYQLAKRLGHERIYPVDVDGEFPYPRVVKFAQATGRDAEFEALMQEGAKETEEMNAFLASHSILEVLLDLNSDASSARDVGSYFRMAEFGEAWDWAGADLVSDWFRRNMRIYSNIVGLAESDDERILVIYGAGHLGWLQLAFGANPNFELRTLAEFVDPG